MKDQEARSLDVAQTQMILLIEDDLHVREAAAGFLQQNGYSVVACATGGEALAVLCDAAPPHVIVLDLHLPDISGWELTVTLKQEPRWARIPVVIVSGDESAVARAIRSDAHLTKPLDGARLLKAIRGITTASRRSQRTEDASVQGERATSFVRDVVWGLAKDLKEVAGQLQGSREQCVSLHARARPSDKFALNLLRGSIEHAEGSARELTRAACAAHDLVDDALSHAAEVQKSPLGEPLH